jgi:hypothetical protein
MTNPDFRALCAELVQQLEDALDFTVSSDTRVYTKELTRRARAALSQPAPEPIPHNCWLDEEYPCPTACVFDDPAECITDCTFAAKLEAEQRPKTACKHYRSEPLSQPAPCWPAGGREMADPTPNRPPLWEVMHCAYSPHREPGQWRLGYAAELRAIADWLVPDGDPDTDCIVPEHGRYLHTLLLAEANRAEAGLGADE